MATKTKTTAGAAKKTTKAAAATAIPDTASDAAAEVAATVAHAGSAQLTLGVTPYREINAHIRELIAQGVTDIELDEVFGQRYIGDALPAGVSLSIHGTPGNDMAAYMDGASIEVFGNGQDQIANTMNEGHIVVHGHCGDAVGYAMRGGEIFVRDYVGWRVGIHMKQYKTKRPVIVIGGDAGSFLGEYMAGGVIILMGKPGRYLATGMHAGILYLRGGIDDALVAKGLVQCACEDEDDELLESYIAQYNRYFSDEVDEVTYRHGDFTKIVPLSSRPYGSMYTNV